MIDSEHFELVYQIGELLESKLDCKIKDHGLWRVQCLIHDTLEDQAKMSEEQKKELTTN